MRGYRATGTEGTDLLGGVVAYSENEMQLRCVLVGKFAPAFAAQAFCEQVCGFKLTQRFRPNQTRRLGSRTVGGERWPALRVQNGFGPDRPGRIACAQEENVIRRRQDGLSYIFVYPHTFEISLSNHISQDECVIASADG
jgi:hypothetical protein